MNIYILILLSIETIVGVFINIKKIRVVLKEKHITWELEIYHSIVSMVYVVICNIHDVLEYTCDNFDGLDSIIFIYSASVFIKLLALRILLSHTLAVASYKYYKIVHSKPLPGDDNRMEKAFLIVIVIFQLMWYVGNLSSNFTFLRNIVSLKSICNVKIIDTNFNLVCTFDDTSDSEANWTPLHVVTKIYCYLESFITLILNLNIIEGLLYIGIFRFMNR